jgi:hexosaminidase
METLGGFFTVSAETVVLVDEDEGEVKALGEYASEYLGKAAGLTLNLDTASSSVPPEGAILLTTRLAKTALGPEGYELTVSPASVTVRAPELNGLFYGLQTLVQLIPVDPADNRVPCVRIEDTPRFKWRGMHLDVGRHFFDKEYVKRYIDLIALHKMNTFHIHLTEDQGWRIEIKKYPKLTEIGSKRKESPVRGNRKKGDGTPYGGFFTQNDIREIVEHARKRYITVVPEVEMPGHSLGALAAYPELSCTGGPHEVMTRWGVFEDVYCAGNDKVFEFMEDVLTDVMELFPSEYIHIGGDECPKARWEKCPKCQARIKNEGLKDEHELQSYFIKRIEKFLNSKGRRLIGWDEILEGGLAPNASVMSWRGTEGGIAAARSGHDVVMSPTTHCYFDYYQSKNRKEEPEAIGGFLPLEKVYSFEPVPAELTPEQGKHVVGAQGNVWTEYIHTPADVEYMALPRMCALAEVVWTPAELKDWDDFRERLDHLTKRLDAMGVNYRKPE